MGKHTPRPNRHQSDGRLMHKPSTENIISALRILADQIQAQDEVPATCLREAAERLEELELESRKNHFAATLLVDEQAETKKQRELYDVSRRRNIRYRSALVAIANASTLQQGQKIALEAVRGHPDVARLMEE